MSPPGASGKRFWSTMPPPQSGSTIPLTSQRSGTAGSNRSLSHMTESTRTYLTEAIKLEKDSHSIYVWKRRQGLEGGKPARWKVGFFLPSYKSKCFFGTHMLIRIRVPSDEHPVPWIYGWHHALPPSKCSIFIFSDIIFIIMKHAFIVNLFWDKKIFLSDDITNIFLTIILSKYDTKHNKESWDRSCWD